MSADNKENNSLDLKEILSAMLSKWYLLCIMVAVCLVASIVYSCFIATPMYTSTGKIYVVNKEAEVLTTNEFAVSSYFTWDFEELIKDSAVLDEVSEEIGGKYSAAYIESVLTVKNPEDTRFIEFSVTTPSATDSKRIIDALCTVSQEKVTDIMGADRISVVRRGNVSQSPSSPSLASNMVKALLLAVVVFCAVVFLEFFFNDKIVTPDDVEKNLGLSVLGNIPCNYSKLKGNKS